MSDCSFHEAGHAVVAEVLGVGVDDVICYPNGGGIMHPVDRTWSFNQVVVYFAGGAAEKRARGYGEPSTGDLKDIAYACPNELQPLQRVAEAHARFLVERHWPQIVKVAAGLRPPQRLTGDQVRRLMEDV